MTTELLDLSFYLLIDCPACDTEIHYGPNVSLLAHHGRPVISIEMFTQFKVECPDCGKTVYAGELDLFIDDDSEDAHAPA